MMPSSARERKPVQQGNRKQKRHHHHHRRRHHDFLQKEKEYSQDIPVIAFQSFDEMELGNQNYEDEAGGIFFKGAKNEENIEMQELAGTAATCSSIPVCLDPIKDHRSSLVITEEEDEEEGGNLQESLLHVTKPDDAPHRTRLQRQDEQDV